MIERYARLHWSGIKLVTNAPTWAKDLVCELHKRSDGKEDFNIEYDSGSPWIMRIFKRAEGHFSVGDFVDNKVSVDEMALALASESEQELYQWAADHCSYRIFEDAKRDVDCHEGSEFLKNVQHFIAKDIICKVYRGHLEESKQKG